MIEVTLLRDGQATRVVRMTGLFENAVDLMAALRVKVPPQDYSDDVTFEFCLVEEIAEHRDNGGEYELPEVPHADGPLEVRAWALHTTRSVTVRSTDYDRLLLLYFSLMHGSPASLNSLRTQRSLEFLGKRDAS